MITSITPLIINLIIFSFDYKVKSPFISFSLATLIVFSIPHFFLSSFSNQFLESTYFLVTIQANIFLLVYLFSRLLFFKVTHESKIPDITSDFIDRQFSLSLLFFCFFIFSSVYNFGFNIQNMMSSSWSDNRNSSNVITLIGSFFLYAASSFFLLALHKKSKKSYFLIFSCLLYIVFILKTRNYLIAILIPVFIYFLLNSKWSIKKLMIASLLSIVVFSLYSAARNIRHMGTVDDIRSSSFELTIDTGEFEVINTLYYFVEKEDFKLDYNNITLVRVLTIPIPSILLPFNKPEELSNVLWNKKTGITGVSGSLHPTVIGDSILNMSIYGPALYGFFYSFIFFLLELFYRQTKYKFLYFGLYCTVSFYIARGAVYNGFVILFVCMFILVVTNLLLGLFKGKHLCHRKY